MPKTTPPETAPLDETPAAAIAVEPAAETDPTAIEVRSKKPGYYPGLGLMVVERGFYSPNDAARILRHEKETNDPDFAVVAAADISRLRKMGLIPKN